MLERQRPHFWHYFLLAIILALLGWFLLVPILLTVRGGFAADPATGQGFTLDHLFLVFRDPLNRTGLMTSGLIACCTTILCILIALPLAVLNAGYAFPGKKLLNAAALVPLILPPFVGAIGLRAILGRQGAINTLLGTDWDVLGQGRFWGVVIAEALHLYPIIYLNATAALANLDPALKESAENLGAGPLRRFVRITLPLIRPGLFAGGTIVFIWSFTELGTPLMFDLYTVTPVQIFFGLKEVENSAEPYALTVVLLACSIALYTVGRILFGGRGHAMYSKAARAGSETQLQGPAAYAAAAAFFTVGFLAVLPHIGVVLTSIAAPGAWYGSILPEALTAEHFRYALSDPAATSSIRNSLILSAAAMTLDIGVGLVIAYLLVRTTVRGRAVLDALCMLPLAVPGLVMAFGYVAMSLAWPFGRDLVVDNRFVSFSLPQLFPGVLEVFGANPNPFPLLVIAYAVRRLPYIVRATVAGLEQTSGELEEAAVNLGASRPMAVLKVIVPLIMANLIAGGLLVFSFSMLEVSDSLILAQKTDHYPITKQIFAFSEMLGVGQHVASAMGVWGMALLTTTLVGASLLLGKKLGSIFRV
jgi:iron(III) transport system permease protein